MFGGDIYLKLENLLKTGSFKIGWGDLRHHEKREDIGPGCVVAASAGNQDQGVALAARQLNIPATIVPNGTFVQNVIYFCTNAPYFLDIYWNNCQFQDST